MNNLETEMAEAVNWHQIRDKIILAAGESKSSITVEKIMPMAKKILKERGFKITNNLISW